MWLSKGIQKRGGGGGILVKTLTHMWGVYCLWLVSVLSHSLSYNKIGDEGMIAMSKAACHWTNLQELK